MVEQTFFSAYFSRYWHLGIFYKKGFKDSSVADPPKKTVPFLSYGDQKSESNGYYYFLAFSLNVQPLRLLHFPISLVLDFKKAPVRN